MCRYCNYNLSLHYLINNNISWQESTIAFNEDIDLTSEDEVLTISIAEDSTSSYQVPNYIFTNQLEANITYNATLANGDRLPDWISFNSINNTFIFQPNSDNVGSHEIVVNGVDIAGKSISYLFSLEVNNVDNKNLPTPDEFTDNLNIGSSQIAIDDVKLVDSSAIRDLTFTVSLDTASDEVITVDYTSADNTAIAGEDYTAVSGTLTFQPGETEKTITVNNTGTSWLDDDESFLINLSNPNNAGISDSQGEGTLLPAYAGVRGSRWQNNTITFSFFEEDVFGQGGYYGSSRESNAREVSDVIKESYRQIFEGLGTFVDRTFVEVQESESNIGNIRILVSDGPSYAYAGSHIHLAPWAAGSDVGSNGWESVPGVYAYAALIHELGHALGLPHTFSGTATHYPEDNSSNSVMSYTFPGNHPGTFMPYDIKVLQETYGAREYRADDTIYQFVEVDTYQVGGELFIDSSSRMKQTIWDSAGIDTFDFSQLEFDADGYHFDLNQGKYQTTQTGYQGSSYTKEGVTYYVPTFGTAIALDVEIENLINSGSNDTIIANPVANVFSGYGLDLKTGKDTLFGTDNLDSLDLSEFTWFDLTQIQENDDLVIEWSVSDSVTIADYYSQPEAARINILLDGVEASISDVSIVEGDSGTKFANFTVNLDAASSEVVNIGYATEDGNAKVTEDYTEATGTVSFNPGETSKTISVEVLGDIVGEANETFTVNLLGTRGQVIASSSGTITNDDGTPPLPTLTIENTSATDGNEAAKAIFTISLDRPTDNPVTVDYTTQDGTAIAGEDYTATNGSLTFAVGETSKTVAVDILKDSLIEGDEAFSLELSNVSANATISDSQGIGNIVESTLDITFADNSTDSKLIASYPPNGSKDPNNLPFAISEDHKTIIIEGNSNGWKEIPLVDNLASNDSPLTPYTVVEFDFKSDEAGKLHGLHFEGRDHHAYYAPWEEGRFFQLFGDSVFGIQDFNNYDDSFGEWKSYQIPVGQFITDTRFHDGSSKAVQWLVFAHEGSNADSNSQFQNVEFKELLPLSIDNVTVNESDNIATFTVTIPEASSEIITVNYSTADDTAIAGQDYIAASGTVTFAPGETSQTIDITINDDNESEAEENFNLNLGNVSNAISFNQRGIVTLEDDEESLPIISVADINLNEGNSDTTTALLTLTLDKPATQTISVDYTTQDATATAGEDYTATTGTVTFNTGATQQTIEVTINGDTFNETNENFLISLTNAVNATINNNEATVTIDNDDALPTISIRDGGVKENIPITNNAGSIVNTTALLFTVSLDAPSNQTVQVNYATADDTAIVGEDYSAKNRTLTFLPGETEKRIAISVTLDGVVEGDETLNINLTNPVNATIADSQAIGTIEETRSLSVSDIQVSENGTEAIFTISLDQPTVQTVFFNYATENGTAQAGTDYIETKGILGIKAGEASTTIAVPLINNNVTEADETFLFNLTNPKYVLIADAQAQATILNDDAPLVNAPGGIQGDLQFWHKANAGVTVNGNDVTAWNDRSQGNNNFTELFSGTNPSLNSEGINFNPTIEFNDTSDRLGSSSVTNFPTSAITQFLVFQRENPNRNEAYFSYANSQSNEFLLFNSGSETEVTMNNSSRDVATKFEDNPVILGLDWQAETGAGHLYNNGSSFEFTGSTKAITAAGTIVLGEEQDSQGGGFSSSQAFLGQLAENIIFDRVLTDQERQQVESYLGIKYGTTLDQTNPTHYLTSSGSIIWNATNAGEYNQDIAGIAVDNDSALNQLKSKSSNNDGIVMISNANNLEDGEALIWSNNNQSLDAAQVTISNGITHLTRQWQVQETGEVGTVNLSFDLAGLGFLIEDVSKFSLLIDDDGDFSNATVHNTGISLDGDEVSFTDVNLSNNNYFTLAVPDTEAPGGIKTNLQLWLQADDGVTAINNSVSEWRDRSGKGRNYTPSDINNQPILESDGFNFNSVVSFDGNDALIKSRENFIQGEVFFVLKGQDNGSTSRLLSDRSAYDTSYLKFEQWSNTGKLGFTRRGITDYASQINSPFNELSLVSFSSEENNNIYNIAVENNGNLAQDNLDIGASRPLPLEYLADGFKGKIAEVIVYDAVLNETDKLKLRSNLAIKYGLTLEQNTNYISADNSLWWDATINNQYNYNIAGIAKDSSSGLEQVQSKSSNADSIVTISNASNLDDGEALMWGSNDRKIQSSFLQVDGVNDYAEIADNDAIDFSNNQDFTVEVRVKTDGSTDNDAIVEKWNQSGGYPYVIRYKNNKILAARWDSSNNPSITSTSNINDGQFHHVAFVKEGNELRLYIDGELEGTTTDTTTDTTTNNSPVYLGSRGGNKEFFNGDIDDVRIWNEARSEAEIKRNQGGINPNETGLVAYLPMENGAVDITGNNHDATLQNEASIIKSASHNLPPRIWQVQENNGDVGTVTVSFDLNQLGYHFNTATELAKFALLIGDDDSFSNPTFHTTGKSIENNIITFTGVDFNNGDYFTLSPRYNNPDIVKKGNNLNEQIKGGNTKDILNGDNGSDRLFGYGDDDIIYGDELNDLLKGGDGNDELSGGDGDDRLYGENDNDTLSGGNGRDILLGGAGDDFLDGGTESDRLIGNDGNDTFVLEEGDLIYDYLDGTDRLGLSSEYSFSDLSIIQSGTNTEIRLQSNSELLAILYQVNSSAIDINDFDLV